MAETQPHQIYGVPFSTCTCTVQVALEELKIPYNINFVNVIANEHKTPEYLEEKNPFGQIPVLVRVRPLSVERFDWDLLARRSRMTGSLYMRLAPSHATLLASTIRRARLYLSILAGEQRSNRPCL